MGENENLFAVIVIAADDHYYYRRLPVPIQSMSMRVLRPHGIFN